MAFFFGDGTLLFGDPSTYIPPMGRPRGSKNKYSSRERFADCHEVDPQTGCWNWTAGSSPSTGYGSFRRDGHTLAHRWSYATFVKPIPKGMWVLHRCDNGMCVNPDHLFLGDVDANNKDMVAKGRHYSKGKTFEEVYGEEEAARKKARLSEWATANPPPPEARKRQAEKVRGQKRSAETRAKMSVALKAAHARNPRPPPTPEQRAAQSARITAWWAARKATER